MTARRLAGAEPLLRADRKTKHMPAESTRLPDAVRMTYGRACRLNAWAMIAVLAAVGSRLWLRSPELTGPGRVAVALLPLWPAILYARAVWRWVTALDELQRRLQQEAIGFAVIGMLLLTLGIDLARVGGVATGLTLGWEGFFVGTFLLWTLGVRRANARYR